MILPWNDPLRVAERISMLDTLSGGRVRFGMGRGLSRREYAPWIGIEMDEARARFDEAAPMITEALRTGFMEGDGPFYEMPRTEIRPRPAYDWDGRIYSVAGSSDSVKACAAAGARMIMFAEKHWENRLPGIEEYRRLYREDHGAEPPGLMTADFVYCHPDGAHAKEVAERHMTTYLLSILEHYELMDDHFSEIKGYRGYAKQAELLRKVGVEGFVKGFLASNAYGTPDTILERLKERREVLGPFEAATCFRFGGLAIEDGGGFHAAVRRRGPTRAAHLGVVDPALRRATGEGESRWPHRWPGSSWSRRPRSSPDRWPACCWPCRGPR